MPKVCGWGHVPVALLVARAAMVSLTLGWEAHMAGLGGTGLNWPECGCYLVKGLGKGSLATPREAPTCSMSPVSRAVGLVTTCRRIPTCRESAL